MRPKGERLILSLASSLALLLSGCRGVLLDDIFGGMRIEFGKQIVRLICAREMNFKIEDDGDDDDDHESFEIAVRDQC